MWIVDLAVLKRFHENKHCQNTVHVFFRLKPQILRVSVLSNFIFRLKFGTIGINSETHGDKSSK